MIEISEKVIDLPRSKVYDQLLRSIDRYVVYSVASITRDIDDHVAIEVSYRVYQCVM